MTVPNAHLILFLPAFVKLGKTGDVVRFLAGPLPERTFIDYTVRWDLILELWEMDDVRSLIKGFTLAERASSTFYYGSVSPIPDMFAVYERRATDDEINTLEEWVLKNSDNPYLPYRGLSYPAEDLRLLRIARRRANKLWR